MTEYLITADPEQRVEVELYFESYVENHYDVDTVRKREVFYEHGQWWGRVYFISDDDFTFSAVDVEVKDYTYVDFEQV